MSLQLLVKDADKRLPLTKVENDPWIRANVDPDVLVRK